MKPFLFNICLFFFAGTKIFGQAPELYFEQVSEEQGLSNNNVNCIIQDRQGFIWIGTDDGLNRYDGKNFKVFRHDKNNTGSLSGNMISDMVEDADGIIWIATRDGGLSKYNRHLPQTKQFKQYKHHPQHPHSIPVNIINTLLDDEKGNLWLGTSGKAILRFNKKTERFDVVSPKGPKTINDLCLDEDGQLLAGRQGGGFLKVNTTDLQYYEDERYHDLYAKLPHSAITSLYRDGNNNLWFGSWDQLLYMKSKASIISFGDGKEQGFIPDEINAFAEDNNGYLWMGGKNRGLQLLDIRKNIFYHFNYDNKPKGSVISNKINCIYKDDKNRMWLGTDKGISISNPFKQQFKQVFFNNEGKEKIQVYDYMDVNGRLLMGTSNGLYILENNIIKHQPVVFENRGLHVTSLFKDGKNIYLGTDRSFFIYNLKNGTLSLLPNTEKDEVIYRIIDSRIVSITKEKINGKSSFIVSPYGHLLAYYIIEEQKWVSRLDAELNIATSLNIRDNLIKKILKTSDGELWLANTKEGLGYWQPLKQQPIKYYQHQPGNPGSISNNHVSDIISSNDGNLWVSSYGGGLHYFNTELRNFTHIRESPNLVESICMDNKGNIWLVYNGRIGKYDPVKKSFTGYTLPDKERSGGVKGKIFKDEKGFVYTAGENYFIRFHPDSVSEHGTAPPIHFTDFSVFNTSFSHYLEKDKIQLNYKDKYFSFEFAAPYYEKSSPIEYAYQLEGFNDEWMPLGDRNYAIFSNLPYGEYVFKVRSSHVPGIWNPQIASIKIEIIPPFWKTTWFFLLCIAAASAGIFAIYKYRINELLKRQEIRNRIAQDLHDNVGSTLSSISVYGQVAKIYQAQKKDGELKATLEKITDASVEMISELNDTVWAINPKNDQFKNILGRMETYTRPLLAAKGIEFEFSFDKKLDDLIMEMEKRKNFYLVYKEAINNAIKYASCSKIIVHMQQKENRISMTITDNGKGFELGSTSEGYKSSDAFGSGNGLKNMQLRANQLKGILKIASTPGEGTKIFLNFPVT